MVIKVLLEDWLARGVAVVERDVSDCESMKKSALVVLGKVLDVSISAAVSRALKSPCETRGEALSGQPPRYGTLTLMSTDRCATSS